MPSTHEWTKFEENTLLALMVKGVHITNLDLTADTSKKKKYMDIATALNTACHKGQYADDIPWKAVADKAEHWIKTKKAGVAMMERHRVGHVTRTMKRVWNRGIKFDGTMREWEAGRKDTVHLESNTGVGSDGWDNNPVAMVESGEQVDDGWGDTVQDTISSEAVANTDDVWDEQVATTAPASYTTDPWDAPATLASQTTASDPWGTVTNSEAQASTAIVASADQWSTASSKEAQAHTATALKSAVNDSWAAPVSQTITTNPWGTVSNTEVQGSTVSGPTKSINDSWGSPATNISQTTTLDPWGTLTSDKIQVSKATADPFDSWGATSNDDARAHTGNAVIAGVEASTAIGNSPDPWTRAESPDPFNYDPGIVTLNSGAADDIAAYSVRSRKSTASKASTATTNHSGYQWGSTSTTASTVWDDGNRSIQPIILASNNGVPAFNDPWTTDRTRKAGPPANSDPWRNRNKPVSPKTIPQHGDITTTVANMYSAQPDDLWAMNSVPIMGDMEGAMARSLSENQHQPRASDLPRPVSQDLGCTTVACGMNPERLRMLSKASSEFEVVNMEDPMVELAENDGVQSDFKIRGSNMIPLRFNRLAGEDVKVATKDVRELEGNDAMDLNE